MSSVNIQSLGGPIDNKARIAEILEEDKSSLTVKNRVKEIYYNFVKRQNEQPLSLNDEPSNENDIKYRFESQFNLLMGFMKRLAESSNFDLSQDLLHEIYKSYAQIAVIYQTYVMPILPQNEIFRREIYDKLDQLANVSTRIIQRIKLGELTFTDPKLNNIKTLRSIVHTLESIRRDALNRIMNQVSFTDSSMGPYNPIPGNVRDYTPDNNSQTRPQRLFTPSSSPPLSQRPLAPSSSSIRDLVGNFNLGMVPFERDAPQLLRSGRSSENLIDDDDSLISSQLLPTGPNPSLRTMSSGPSGPNPSLRTMSSGPSGPNPSLRTMSSGPTGPNPSVRTMSSGLSGTNPEMMSSDPSVASLTSGLMSGSPGPSESPLLEGYVGEELLPKISGTNTIIRQYLDASTKPMTPLEFSKIVKPKIRSIMNEFEILQQSGNMTREIDEEYNLLIRLTDEFSRMYVRNHGTPNKNAFSIIDFMRSQHQQQQPQPPTRPSSAQPQPPTRPSSAQPQPPSRPRTTISELQQRQAQRKSSLPDVK